MNPNPPSLFPSPLLLYFRHLTPQPPPPSNHTPFSPPIKIQIPTPQKQQEEITDDKRRVNAQIPPPVREIQAERARELVPNLVRAVPAHLRRVLREVPGAAGGEEIRHVIPARGAGGGGEGVELGGRADDGAVVQFRDDHAADEAREGVQLVEPAAPEPGDLRRRHGDAAEHGEDDNHEGVQQRGDEGARRQGGDGLGQGDCEEFHDQDHEELVAGAAGAGLEARHEVEREVEADGAKDAVRDLGEYHGQREGKLLVRFGGGLAVEDEARKIVFGFHLGEDQGRDDGGLWRGVSLFSCFSSPVKELKGTERRLPGR